MSLSLLDLPAEILGQIFLNAISARTPLRALRLRLVSQTFERYTTEAILLTDILDETIKPLKPYTSLLIQSMRHPVGVPYGNLGRPKWLPLVVRYLCKQMCKRRHMPDEPWRNAYIWRLTHSLYEWRLGLAEEKDRPKDEMLRCLEIVVELDLFKANWIRRKHLLDPIDDGAWDPNAETSDLLDIAVWINDMKLIRQLLPLEDAEVHDDAWKAERLSWRLLMAAEHGNFETLRFLNSHFRGIDAGFSNQAVCSLLVRGYLTKNPALFHFALDQFDEDDPISLNDLEFIASYCPSAYAYRRIIDIIRKEEPVLSYRSHLYSDRSGHSRLSMAARYGYLDLVEYFVEGFAPWYGDPVQQRDAATDVEVAERKRLISRGLLGAAHGGCLPTAKYLLSKGADPNTYVCLNAAIRHGHGEMARLLIEHGADVMLGTPPPIAVAVAKEDMVSFRYLLEKGALSGDSYVHAGSWAMGVAKALGLDSMVGELVQVGVPEEARMHWVPTKGERLKFPLRLQDYERSVEPWG